MKPRKLLWLLVFVLIVAVAASCIALRVQNRRARETRRKMEAATHAVGETFVPDTSPPRFSR